MEWPFDHSIHPRSSPPPAPPPCPPPFTGAVSCRRIHRPAVGTTSLLPCCISTEALPLPWRVTSSPSLSRCSHLGLVEVAYFCFILWWNGLQIVPLACLGLLAYNILPDLLLDLVCVKIEQKNLSDWIIRSDRPDYPV